jgi:hypothetical protein
VAEKKVYLGSQGPYLFDDSDTLNDPDGDFSGQGQVGIVSDSQVVATEFVGIPISSISVTNIDDPSTELNPLSASTVGGLIAVYQAVNGSDDEFTMYLWDTNAAAENPPYTVDGSGGVWIAVGGKYSNMGVNLGGDINLDNLTASRNLVLDGDKDIAVHTPASHEADSSTSHSITDPADSPATADALRDDLVANAIPDIESALNALGTKINAILVILENSYLMNDS